MADVFHTAELSARTATRLLAEVGADRVGEVLLPTNLIGLVRLVNKVYEGTQAMQLTADLRQAVSLNVEWLREAGVTVETLRRPAVMNTLEAAQLAISLGDYDLPVGSRDRGLAVSRTKIAFDMLICHANGLHPHLAAYVSEGYRLLAEAEPKRVALLMCSLGEGRYGDLCKALVEYAAAAKRATARAELGIETGGPDLAEMEAAKDEAAADAEHYGY